MSSYPGSPSYDTAAEIAGSAINRLSLAQDEIYKATDALEARLTPLLGSILTEAASVAPDSPPGTAIHNAATIAEAQASRLRRLTDRLEV